MVVAKDNQGLRDERDRVGSGGGEASTDVRKDCCASDRASAQRSLRPLVMFGKSISLWGTGYPTLVGRTYL